MRPTPLTGLRFQHSQLKSLNSPQQFHVVPDTGSVDLWIDSSKFDRSASHTFQQVGGPATINFVYHSGSVTGDVAEDVVTFGGYTNPHQRFLLGTTMTNPPVAPRSGNLGLPAPDAAPGSAFGADPFWPAVRKNDPKIDSQLSFKFPPKPGSTREAREVEHNQPPVVGGVLTVGGQNTTLFTGDVEFLPLFTFGGLNTYWALPVLGLCQICARLVLGSFSPTPTNLSDRR